MVTGQRITHYRESEQVKCDQSEGYDHGFFAAPETVHYRGGKRQRQAYQCRVTHNVVRIYRGESQVLQVRRDPQLEAVCDQPVPAPAR